MTNEDFLSQSGSTTTTWDIPTLVKYAITGRVRVPQFQRSFVWDAQDVRKLFDSIYRGFPIGTLLLWQQALPASVARFGPLSLDVPAHSDAYWVIDGQQRLTSLVVALASEPAIQDDRFDVYFDLSRRRFVGPVRGARPPRSIPVRETLESRRLLTWLRANGEDFSEEDLEMADRLGGAIRDYRVPAYLVAEADEKVLREVFDRVNSSGKPISRAQVFHALFTRESDDSSPRTVVENLQAAGFGRIEESRVIQSLLAIRGGDVQRDLHDEFSSNEDPTEWYDHTEQSLFRVIEFIKSCGIPHALLLPLTLPIPILAAFFHLHPEPDTWTKKLLARWLWRGLISGFGRESGQTPALRRGVRTVNPIKGDQSAAPGEFGAVKQLLDILPTMQASSLPTTPFITKTSSARFILLSLLTLRPLTPNAEALDTAESLDRSGFQSVGQLIPGSRSDAANRGFWAPEWPQLNGQEEPMILHSHAVSDLASSYLRDKNYDQFRVARRAEIDRLSKTFMERKIEDGALTRPPLDALIVGDEDE
ncbi:DUF262 domain-containing protein [Rathayibacter sp. VKM Ac-2760]|uniref:DUF262 domain-containing protein n=1 Tax=Rathayibacter sp. VKM Ac-2760 TaxID=2609253 RepID=UPI0013166C68|nr:DUF262 domain-containing protein [Rathayibacter sp. VKM Ac-2760]QHC57526.1 DUF262 domain-containing protein [Rathayibacter sp. VKM Ac-2760]